MRKLFLFSLILCFFSCRPVSQVWAQDVRTQAREAEWQSYSLPKTNFIRQTNPGKDFLFRVPADWKQEGASLTFDAPQAAKLTVYVEKVSDGLPLADYVMAIMRTVRGTPGVAESAILRRTEIQDLEAREIVLEFPNPEGEMTRTVLWVIVNGPLAVTFSLATPLAHAAEVEPLFKAVVQSAMFVNHLDYAGFEAFRSTKIKTSAPSPIHELQTIIASLEEKSDREPAVARLASMFASTPDTVIDLLIDRRPLIRAVAVEALTRSRNATLDPFLWRAVDDRELRVAEHAARSVANTPDVLAELSEQSFGGLKTETLAHVWPFLGKDKRNQILQEIFSRVAQIPFPVSAAPTNSPTKHDVKVVVTELTPKTKEKSLAPGASSNKSSFSQQEHVQLAAITLLRDVKPYEFKLPLALIVAAESDMLTAAALQTANERSEALPVDLLLKLVMSSNKRIERLAAESLGLSATVSDIARIEKLIALPGTRPAKPSAKDNTQIDLPSQLKLSIKKIRFRDQLTNATKTSAQSLNEVIKQGLSDPELAGFVWRHVCEVTPQACGLKPATETVKSDFNVKRLAENLFPERVEHFAALPNPGQTAQRFYESLQSIQMDSPRSQSSLALMMGGFRKLLGQELSAPAESTLFDSTGIKADAPISMASWLSNGAPEGLSAARHQAIVLRIRNRDRLERLVEVYQRRTGAFAELPGYLAGISRGLAALPAVLPISVQAFSAKPIEPKEVPVLRYSLVRYTESNGLPIKIIEHRQVFSDGRIENSATYLAILGNTAILTTDLAGMRDLLGQAVKPSSILENNPEFRKVSNRDGDVIYFSDLESLLASLRGPRNEEPLPKINESGELKILKSSWENLHRLSFDESDWSKSLLTFQPGDLSAPVDLLPASTVAYYFMKLDLSSVWTKWIKPALDQKDKEASAAFWSASFEQDVLPELGPECGIALMDVPSLEPSEGDPTWVAFCKLKSDKLKDMLTARKLIRVTGEGSTKAKGETDSDLVAVKNGFLVISNRNKGLVSLDQQQKLASTRDFSRAVTKVPGGIVAFGGYNVDAAIAAVTVTPSDGLNARTAEVFTSLAKAFHSQNLFATASAGKVEAQSSVAMDREGRYAISDLSYRPTGSNITYVTVETRGIPIVDQKRLSRLVLRIRAKVAGAIERIKEDVKSPHQTVEQKSAEEIVITVTSRKPESEAKVLLPINNPDLAQFLKPTQETPSDNEQIIKQAREIVGDDRDAWSVAHKLAEWTYKNLEWKFVVSGNATQTLATREADCSEFSQLFVAMARSVGLPARIVSGLAHSGTSFGGHAWVEVWAGRWIELDPTWGTDFVDATHIRNDSSALLTYAALNLIELEVLDTRRTIPDYQLNPRSLAEQLAKTIPTADSSVLESALDVAITTDILMNKGAWAGMSEAERDQIASAYRRAMVEVLVGYVKDKDEEKTTHSIRVLHVNEKDDQAEVICLTAPEDDLLKFHLMRQGYSWHLIEILYADTDLRVVYESLKPTIQALEDRRAGRKSNFSVGTDFERVLLLMAQKPQKAIEIADGALKLNPSDRGMSYLKALALLHAEKRNDGIKLLIQISKQHPDFAPVFKKLAELYAISEDEAEKKQVGDLYKRYLSLEPYDSRAHLALARLYDNAEDNGQAEAAYRKAVEVDSTNSDLYRELAEFLVHQNRLREAAAFLDTGEKYKGPDEDLFDSIIQNLYFTKDYDCLKSFSASQPARMRKSMTGNLYMGWMFFEKGRYLQALRLFRLAAQLNQKSTAPLIAMAEGYRKISHWKYALRVADQAIGIDPEDAHAHYQRACALARLGQRNTAMAALTRSIELDSDFADLLEEEDDLKSLATLPAFRKLMPEAEKPN